MAPLALIAFALADRGARARLGSRRRRQLARRRPDTRELPAATETATTEKKQKRTPKTYTIKANDTLSGIAEQNGTTVERLLELNPELDPQGLVAGQKIKLRE